MAIDASAFHVIAVLAMLVMAALLSVLLFEPGLEYVVRDDLPPSDSHESRGIVSAVVDVAIMPAHSVDLLNGGKAFYAAELEAIHAAQRSIHIEAYIFRKSLIADRFLRALEARARDGVTVRLIVDAIGSAGTPDSYFEPLRAAGGHMAWYQPIRWSTLKRWNHRTHRELLVMDGEVGFIGGAGIFDWWDEDLNGERAWRDTMVRVNGPLASALQSAFLENWLESTGELLVAQEDFPSCRAILDRHDMRAANGLVVASAPSAGKATRARMLFQVLLASARSSIRIHSPYFLPDRGVIRELAAAVARGVRVQVIVPGSKNNHPIARRASRRRYLELLQGGVEIFEFQPVMMHAKLMVVDSIWSVVGSTNFDNRSFALNDEVNLALQDKGIAMEMERAFERDLSQSTKVDAASLHRPLGERLLAFAGSMLERHQ